LGRFDFGIDADLERLAGWTGAKLHANTYAIYRQGLSRNYIANLATVSETKALPSGRKPGVGDPQLRDNDRAGSSCATMAVLEAIYEAHIKPG